MFAIVSQEYEPTYGFSVEEIIEMGGDIHTCLLGFQSKSDRKSLIRQLNY